MYLSRLECERCTGIRSRRLRFQADERSPPGVPPPRFRILPRPFVEFQPVSKVTQNLFIGASLRCVWLRCLAAEQPEKNKPRKWWIQIGYSPRNFSNFLPRKLLLSRIESTKRRR